MVVRGRRDGAAILRARAEASGLRGSAPGGAALDLLGAAPGELPDRGGQDGRAPRGRRCVFPETIIWSCTRQRWSTVVSGIRRRSAVIRRMRRRSPVVREG